MTTGLAAGHSPLSTSTLLSERPAAVERQILLDSMDKYDWVQTQAAESLGISERVFLYKMKKASIKKKREI